MRKSDKMLLTSMAIAAILAWMFVHFLFGNFVVWLLLTLFTGAGIWRIWIDQEAKTTIIDAKIMEPKK